MDQTLFDEKNEIKLFSETGRLRPKAPFDFQKSLNFLGDFPATRYEQIITPGSLTKAICLDGQVFAFELKGYHQVKFITPFENACWAVIHQRNLLTVSRRMKQGLVQFFDRKLALDG